MGNKQVTQVQVCLSVNVMAKAINMSNITVTVTPLPAWSSEVNGRRNKIMPVCVALSHRIF